MNASNRDFLSLEKRYLDVMENLKNKVKNSTDDIVKNTYSSAITRVQNEVNELKNTVVPILNEVKTLGDRLELLQKNYQKIMSVKYDRIWEMEEFGRMQRGGAAKKRVIKKRVTKKKVVKKNKK